MMQQINLYQPISRKEKSVISAASMLQVALIILLVLGTVYGIDVWQMRTLTDGLAELKDQETERLSHLEGLSKQFPPKRKSLQLEQKIETLETQLNQKNEVIDRFTDHKQGNTSGFSLYLEGLARQSIPNLWLKELQIQSGGEQLSIAGSALEAAQVPRYLRRLAEEDVYAGKEFRMFHLSRPEDDPRRIDFLFGTTIDTVPPNSN